MKETLQQNGYPEHFLSPQCSSRKDREEKDDPRSHVTIPYIQGAVTRILSDINVQVHTLRKILSHPKDRIPSPALCTRSIVVTVMPAM